MSNAITTALVGGGFTLQRLAKVLPSGSFCITSRSAERVADFKRNGWEAVQLELSNLQAVQELFARYPDLTTVVDSVPPIKAVNAGPEAALAGVRALHGAILKSRVQRLFYLSTTGVFGVTDGSEVNEATPTRPLHSRAKARLAAEQAYRELPIAVTAFRIAAIYGGGRGVVQSLQAGRYPYVDHGSRWSNRIHVNDLVEVLRTAIHRPVEETLPPVVCVCDDEPALTSEVVAYFCKKLNLPFPASITVEEAERRGLSTLLSNQKVSNSLLKRTLKVSLQYPTFRAVLENDREYDV